MFTVFGDEVTFETGDACTRILFVHDGATLARSPGEMQSAACTCVAAPVVTWGFLIDMLGSQDVLFVENRRPEFHRLV